jgi:hypothetical protein
MIAKATTANFRRDLHTVIETLKEVYVYYVKYRQEKCYTQTDELLTQTV